MPKSQHDALARRPRAGRIGRLFRRAGGPQSSTVREVADAGTRNDWSRASSAPRTLVEAAPGARGPHGDRVAAMIAAHESGAARAAPLRPPGNPAFAEAVFVELMRAHQYRRAFEHLSAECRRCWGSADAFAAAQGDATMGSLRAFRVTDVSYLDEWTDAERGTTHQGVAELRVEYTVGVRAPVVLPRVVHLVAEGGKWRSLCYPA